MSTVSNKKHNLLVKVACSLFILFHTSCSIVSSNLWINRYCKATCISLSWWASIYANFGVGPPKVDTGSGCLRGWLSSGNFCLLLKRNIVKRLFTLQFLRFQAIVFCMLRNLKLWRSEKWCLLCVIAFLDMSCQYITAAHIS